jgi:hypothetical protein
MENRIWIFTMNELYDKSITDVFWSQTWTIPNIFTAMHVRILECIAQNTELRYRQPSGSEKLGKYSKSMTSRPNTGMQLRDC